MTYFPLVSDKLVWILNHVNTITLLQIISEFCKAMSPQYTFAHRTHLWKFY